jgi:RNA 3'-terminal phosphate cyclase (ATP)
MSLSLPAGKTLLYIDGSQGEGGGQILRSALTLSMLLQQPFQLVNIRAGRAKPGLLRQHLTCVQAAAAICQAEVHGAELGADTLTFLPGTVRAGHYQFAIGSAGSTSLVLQTLLLPLALAEGPSSVIVEGGTHNGQSPSTDFLQQSFLPLLARMGLPATLTLQAYGFYPAGGGRVCLELPGSARLTALHLQQPATEQAIQLCTIASGIAAETTHRMLQTAISALAQPNISQQQLSVKSSGPGLMLQASMRQTQDFSLLFENVAVRGVSASQLAAETAAAVQHWRQAGVAVEEHLADQLLLPLAVAGCGSFTTTRPSLHCSSNIEVIRLFGLANFQLTALNEQRWLIRLGDNQV